MRWLPIVLPLGVAAVVFGDFHHYQQSGIAMKLVVGWGVLGLALAGAGAYVTRGRLARPGTFLLCWIVGALAFARVTLQLVWTGAHSSFDAYAMRNELMPMWYALAIGVLCGLGGVAVGRLRAS
jgi:hypothetical protein